MDKVIKPDLSIIIPTYNNQSFLKTAIDSILSNTKLKLEIIIIDDGSESNELKEYFKTDRAFRFLKIFKIICNEKNIGYLKSVNKGISFCSAQYILLINNDVFVPPQAIENMLKSLIENPNFGAVGPYSNFAFPNQCLKLEYTDPLTNPYDLFKKLKKLGNIEPPYQEIAYLSGFCLMLRKDVIDIVSIDGKLFDEIYEYGYFEDSDLCLRIRGLGYKLIIIRNSYIHHYGSKTFSQEKQREYLIKNYATFYNKWGSQITSEEIASQIY